MNDVYMRKSSYNWKPQLSFQHGAGIWHHQTVPWDTISPSINVYADTCKSRQYGNPGPGGGSWGSSHDWVQHLVSVPTGIPYSGTSTIEPVGRLSLECHSLGLRLPTYGSAVIAERASAQSRTASSREKRQNCGLIFSITYIIHMGHAGMHKNKKLYNPKEMLVYCT